jgi:hypothetical protein
MQNDNQNLGWCMASLLTATAVPLAGLISPEEFFLSPKFKFTIKGYCFDSIEEIQEVVLEQLTQSLWKWYIECWGKKGHVISAEGAVCGG